MSHCLPGGLAVEPLQQTLQQNRALHRSTTHAVRPVPDVELYSSTALQSSTGLQSALHLYSSTALYTLHPLHPPSGAGAGRRPARMPRPPLARRLPTSPPRSSRRAPAGAGVEDGGHPRVSSVRVGVCSLLELSSKAATGENNKRRHTNLGRSSSSTCVLVRPACGRRRGNGFSRVQGAHRTYTPSGDPLPVLHTRHGRFDGYRAPQGRR